MEVAKRNEEKNLPPLSAEVYKRDREKRPPLKTDTRKQCFRGNWFQESRARK